jgi:hypothetical protein
MTIEWLHPASAVQQPQALQATNPKSRRSRAKRSAAQTCSGTAGLLAKCSPISVFEAAMLEQGYLLAPVFPNIDRCNNLF